MERLSYKRTLTPRYHKPATPFPKSPRNRLVIPPQSITPFVSQFTKGDINDIKTSTDMVFKALKDVEEQQQQELSADAVDAFFQVKNNIDLFVSGKLSAYVADQNIQKYAEQIHQNRGSIASISREMGTIVSKKSVGIPLSLLSLSMYYLFQNYISALSNLQKIATSSCIGALIAGTTFQEYYDSLPQGNSWLEYASFLLNIKKPTLDKAFLVENALSKVSDMLSGVKYGGSIKNTKTLYEDLKGLGLQINYKEIEKLGPESSESEQYVKSAFLSLGTSLLGTANQFLHSIDENYLGNSIAYVADKKLLEIEHLTAEIKVEFSKNIGDFTNELGLMSSTANSFKNVLIIFIGIFVLIMIYSLIKQMCKCKNKKHAIGYINSIKLLEESKRGHFEFKAKAKKPKKSESKKSKKSESKKSKSNKPKKSESKKSKSKKSKSNKPKKSKSKKFD
jgi:hypothetical protein